MKVEVDVGRLKETRWHEYLLRFFLGGLITALAGWIGKQYGPAYAGLFLGFPAILPAAVTLIESHEMKKKAPERTKEAKDEAGDDSMGAVLGSVAMIVFAVVIWRVPGSIWGIIGLAFAAWLVVAVFAWIFACGLQNMLEKRRNAGHKQAARRPAATT